LGAAVRGCVVLGWAAVLAGAVVGMAVLVAVTVAGVLPTTVLPAAVWTAAVLAVVLRAAVRGSRVRGGLVAVGARTVRLSGRQLVHRVRGLRREAGLRGAREGRLRAAAAAQDLDQDERELVVDQDAGPDQHPGED